MNRTVAAQRVSAVLAASAVAGGLLTLLGWAFPVRRLAAWGPGGGDGAPSLPRKDGEPPLGLARVDRPGHRGAEGTPHRTAGNRGRLPRRSRLDALAHRLSLRRRSALHHPEADHHRTA